jgi:hypothetical protein
MANAVICPETGKSLKQNGCDPQQTRSTGSTTLTQFDSYADQISQKDEK